MDNEDESESLIDAVNHGIEQLERGEGIPFDIEKIKAELEKRCEEDAFH